MTTPLQLTGWYPDPSRAPARKVALPPKDDPFYSYVGSTPLESIAPGTVLQTRSIAYHILGVPTSLKTTQLLYRSTSQTGNPTVNVTSVIQPLSQRNGTKVISYQSAYDSLNRDDEPSYAISGGFTLGGVVPSVELSVFGLFLADGYTVIVPDTEGQRADFAAGPEYGMNTLDSIRAALNSSTVGLPDDCTGCDARVLRRCDRHRVGRRARPGVRARPQQAPDRRGDGRRARPPRAKPALRRGQLILGRRHADGAHRYRARVRDRFHALSQSLRREGLHDLQTASIVNVLGRYAGLKWADLVRPEYPTPESIPLYARLANKLIMGAGGTPTTPLFIGQGAHGELEGTPGNKPGIGAGDGVMIAGDVRTLARGYCAKGTKVHYEQYDALSHITSIGIWLRNAIVWIRQRFIGLPALQNCLSIAPGNPLEPIPVPSTTANPTTV